MCQVFLKSFAMWNTTTLFTMLPHNQNELVIHKLGLKPLITRDARVADQGELRGDDKLETWGQPVA